MMEQRSAILHADRDTLIQTVRRLHCLSSSSSYVIVICIVSLGLVALRDVKSLKWWSDVRCTVFVQWTCASFHSACSTTWGKKNCTVLFWQ